jgi:hypothetical protein
VRTKTVEFEEYPDDSYVVRVSPVAVDDLFAVLDAFARFRTREGFIELTEMFAPFIESWTHPEPVDAAGLRRRDINLVLALIREWREGVGEVPLPLPRRSSDGEPSEAPPESPSP